jgi:hypothetical protein
MSIDGNLLRDVCRGRPDFLVGNSFKSHFAPQKKRELSLLSFLTLKLDRIKQQ